MKKLILSIVVAVVFTGCTKENAQLNVTPQNNSMDGKVADLIKRADNGLYDQCYNSQNQKAPIVTVKSTPGAYVILGGDVAGGSCYPTNGVCFTIISVAKSLQNVTGLVQFSFIHNDFTETYGNDESAHLILNSSPFPTIKEITAINGHFDDKGVLTFFYK
jgi:hypothetical protein